jgi:hypothetical protein
MCIDKVWCHFQHDNASSAPVGGAWDDTETDDVSPELTQIMDHVNIEVIWAGARIEIDMPDTRRSRSTKNEHPLGSEVLVPSSSMLSMNQGKRTLHFGE